MAILGRPQKRHVLPDLPLTLQTFHLNALRHQVAEAFLLPALKVLSLVVQSPHDSDRKVTATKVAYL